ncbi:MAG TPA: type VI secretion system accessory protein TagJ [Aquabacterium sp.]|uniref:type VI secretion system accessory protein TagJ n=1 Tax=Aquabacterium sp. TaxID=1872578 RepID=UPI002E31DD03|nr:type VI secretion system accessory protein TagJ [Aquabacterium sp.]HEX5373964.1 type VI secretion system accessory protein TagJ [Aquabacterium sp.]
MSDALELAETTLRDGDPATALKHLIAAVKTKPADARMRIFMAQLLCVLGQWERAHTQLNVAADLMPAAIPMREMVGHALRCELLRAEVFAGKRAPMVFGHPDQWLAMLIESLLQAGQGNQALADDLAARAFEAAPAVPGAIDGERFEWIADADSRLGPVLEAFVNGKYYWIPFSRLTKISLDVPQDLRDMVWSPAYLTFDNGGEVVAMIPSRYPGSQSSEDPQILLSRKTEWTPLGGAGSERYAGLGQRLLTSNLGDHSLLNTRLIELEPPASSDADLQEPAPAV